MFLHVQKQMNECILHDIFCEPPFLIIDIKMGLQGEELLSSEHSAPGESETTHQKDDGDDQKNGNDIHKNLSALSSALCGLWTLSANQVMIGYGEFTPSKFIIK